MLEPGTFKNNSEISYATWKLERALRSLLFTLPDVDQYQCPRTDAPKKSCGIRGTGNLRL